MNPITGMPINSVAPPPLGAENGSPMAVANANMAASNAKMSMLLKATQGGAKRRRYHSLYGGAGAIVVQPLHVSYPGGSSLQNINNQMTSIGAQNVANSAYDNNWNQQGGKKKTRRRNSRKRKRKSKRRRYSRRM
jgi:hypothetical protein